MSGREIKAVRNPAVSGYSSAGCLMKPWTVFVDGQILIDAKGRPRRFSTETSAVFAARRSIA